MQAAWLAPSGPVTLEKKSFSLGRFLHPAGGVHTHSVGGGQEASHGPLLGLKEAEGSLEGHLFSPTNLTRRSCCAQ